MTINTDWQCAMENRLAQLEAQVTHLLARLPKQPTRKLRPIADTDTMTDKHRAFAEELGIDPAPEWAKFRNYCLAHDVRYANFHAAFRNWLANVPHMTRGKQ
jgi:DNA-binding SARP family transcriptional activator